MLLILPNVGVIVDAHPEVSEYWMQCRLETTVSQFLRMTALNAKHVLAIIILSVRPSVICHNLVLNHTQVRWRLRVFNV